MRTEPKTLERKVELEKGFDCEKEMWVIFA